MYKTQKLEYSVRKAYSSAPRRITINGIENAMVVYDSHVGAIEIDPSYARYADSQIRAMNLKERLVVHGELKKKGMYLISRSRKRIVEFYRGLHHLNAARYFWDRYIILSPSH